MVKTFSECIAEYGSEHALRRQVSQGRLFHVEWGLYADTPHPGFLAIAMVRHPGSVVTLKSAFFYQGLIDVVPEVLHLATARTAKRIADAFIKQHFVPEKILHVGEIRLDRNGTAIRTYDLERLTIEAVRMRTKLDYELYKEVVLSLRARSESLYPAKIQNYLKSFGNRARILDAIEKEIF